MITYLLNTAHSQSITNTPCRVGTRNKGSHRKQIAHHHSYHRYVLSFKDSYQFDGEMN